MFSHALVFYIIADAIFVNFYIEYISSNLSLHTKLIKSLLFTAQTKFSIKDFFSNCDQIRSFLRIWPYLLGKSFMENFIFCAVIIAIIAIINTAWKVSKFEVFLVRIQENTNHKNSVSRNFSDSVKTKVRKILDPVKASKVEINISNVARL